MAHQLHTELVVVVVSLVKHTFMLMLAEKLSIIKANYLQEKGFAEEKVLPQKVGRPLTTTTIDGN